MKNFLKVSSNYIAFTILNEAYTDELYFYWTADFLKGSIQAARFKKRQD